MRKLDTSICEKYWDELLEQFNSLVDIDSISVSTNIPGNIIRKWLSENNIRLSQEQIAEKRRRTFIAKYGVDNPFKSDIVKDKIKNTVLDKYGVDNPAKSDIVKSKIKSSMTDEKIKARTEKTRISNIRKYGVENVSQVELVKAKRTKTFQEKYGVDSALSSRAIQDKIRHTNQIKYGSGSPLGNAAVQSKARKTLFDKYGVEHPLQSEDIRDKFKSTMYSRYGVDAALQSDIFMSKWKATIENRYGNSHTHKVKSIVMKIRQSKISDEAIRILDSKEAMIEYINSFDWKDRTIGNMSEILGVAGCTFGRYCNKYGLDDIVNKNYFTRSHYEEDIYNILSEYGITNLIRSYRNAIHPYEIDLYSTDYKIGIEFNGDYWHSYPVKPIEYHQKKSLIAKNKDIFIYHIWEHEWNDKRKKPIIISQLNNLLGNSQNRIYARKCQIKVVESSIAKSFLNENHMQGYRNAKYSYGLYYNDELVSIMTFGQGRFILKNEISNNTYELVRFCSKLGYSVVGGASKLFKHFVDNHSPEKIISYCDIAKGRGITYEKLGFKLDKITNCNYVWVSADGTDVKTRYQCQKHLIKESDDDSRTEFDIMSSYGYNQIFDCGSYKYIWEKI